MSSNHCQPPMESHYIMDLRRYSSNALQPVSGPQLRFLYKKLRFFYDPKDWTSLIRNLVFYPKQCHKIYTINYSLSSRTLTINLSTEINCPPQDFIRIFEDNPEFNQNICLKTIAVKHEGEDREYVIFYYCLTKIEWTPPTPINISLSTDTDTLHLSVVINGCLKNGISWHPGCSS